MAIDLYFYFWVPVCKHQPGIWAESVNWKANMVNERRRKAQNKEIKNTGGRSYVPGFQGRTGDVKNNKNMERLVILFYC